MASMALTTTLSRFQSSRATIVRSPWSTRIFVGQVAPKPFQATSRHGTTAAYDQAANAARQGADAAKKAGQEIKHETLSDADDMIQKTKNVAGKVADASKDMTDKAKQTAQDAWGSVKDTTQKIKETVAGKAEETKEFVKENIEKVIFYLIEAADNDEVVLKTEKQLGLICFVFAEDNGEEGLKDMDVVMDSPIFPTPFVVDDIKQEQIISNVGASESGGGGREIWFEEDEQNNNLLDDVNDPSSMFYSDFPPLPDFPCMSSSSSSSSTPVPTKAVAASSSSSSSSSASSSSATSWAVFKTSELADDYYNSERNKNQFNEVAASAAVAALSSTASMEIFPPPDHDGNRDIDCINIMENFGYMDLLDNSDIWDPSSIFESENPPQEFQEKKPMAQNEDIQENQPKEQGNDGNDQLYFLQGNSELAVIFLEWLKQNKDYISAEDMRNIKLRRSTIECASKRLGSTKEGKKQLLKLILEWVEQYQLQKKRTAAADSPYQYQEQPGGETVHPNPNPNTDLNCNPVPPWEPNACFSPPPPWVPPPLPPGSGGAPLVAVPSVAFPPTVVGGYVCDPYSSVAPAVPAPNQTINGNLYPPSGYQPMDCPQSWNAPAPFGMAAQYNPFPDNSNLPVSGAQALYGNPYPCQVFDGSGERLVRLGSSATKEARKKRMARQRRISLHQYRHHNHHNQPQNLMTEQHARTTVGEDCTPSPTNPAGSWIYWSPAAAPPPASAMAPLVSPVEVSRAPTTQPVDRGHMQPQNHQRQAPSERKQGCKTEKNLKFLLQKVLKQSDVGNLGRIVLPKKEAETHLPELESRDGIPIAMEDIGTSNVWNMRYRFWPNNKSRMYLLENTGDFVRVNGLQEGDFIVIYSDTKCGKYLIRGVKVRQPGTKSEVKKPARRNQRNLPQAPTSFSLASFKHSVQ
ncbi:hypothetical protein ACH5RR_010467 [Cinchona calisaya]|uniref:TF-B3 domain-containing protein n=1 Tax=Cinchona calisaya TaxID=153742 RepID=A0ABD3AJ08_9GENT